MPDIPPDIPTLTGITNHAVGRPPSRLERSLNSHGLEEVCPHERDQLSYGGCQSLRKSHLNEDPLGWRRAWVFVSPQESSR
jgi:hypothetical protein